MSGARLPSLACGPLRLVLAPAVGGSIARFDRIADDGPAPILRGADGVPDGPLACASFPLVPFSNRIRDGRFRCGGREVVLQPNMPPDPSPLHGQGWLAPWRVEEVADREATLAFTHEPGEWPWRYDARQTFRLDEDGLSLRLVCRNLSDEPMPCGLGFHPYFPCTSTTRLDTEVTEVWTIDEHVLPVARVAASGRYDLANRLVCGQGLDNGFGGWGGVARIHTPGTGFATRLSSAGTRFFQLYSPSGGALFVAEPVTHANAALNLPQSDWAAAGIRMLAPGEATALDARIAVEPEPVQPSR